MENMSFYTNFLENNKSIVKGYVEHPFINSLINDTLDPKKYQVYLEQDDLFLNKYNSLFMDLICKTTERKLQKSLLEEMISFFYEIKEEERNEVFSQSDFNDVTSVSTKKYLTFLENSLQKYNYSVCLFAFGACPVSYAEIGLKFVNLRPKKSTYLATWKKLYSSSQFQANSQNWITRLNEQYELLSPDQKITAEDAYKKGLECEINFFNQGIE